MFRSFLSLAAADPAAPALIDAWSGAVATRETLLARSRELGTELDDAGLSGGDALAVQLPNSVDFVAAVLAALERELLLVPIDRDSPRREVDAVLAHFAVRALLRRSDAGETRLENRGPCIALPVPPRSRLLKLTSGSTGKPKGIVTTEENLLSDCANICRSMGIAADDVNLGAIPFSHSYGFSNLVTPLIARGTAVVVTNDYLPQALIELANRHRCSVAPLIPMVFDHLSATGEGHFESVRTFISAGAPLPAATSLRFRERFGAPIHSFYGCSECGGITYDREGAAAERGTVGSPMDGVSLDLDGDRLTVRSASVAAGVLLDASTFQAFQGGRFVTDDLAEWQDREIALMGRNGDLINTAGKKVNPREVEEVILQLEGVREVKVFGTAAGARGEVVSAAIVGSAGLSPEAVRQFCRERLSAHKVPRIVKLIDEMPVDERGKVKKSALAALGLD